MWAFSCEKGQMAISHSSRYNIFFSASLRTFLRVHTTYFHGEIKKILIWSCTVSDQPVHCNTSLPCETVKSTVWVREGGAFTKHRTSLARFLAHLSSAQDELLWSLFVRRPSVRASVRPSVRPSVNIFKRLLLWNHWANFAQISYGASLGWGNKTLLKWSRSVDQDGRHAHIW